MKRISKFLQLIRWPNLLFIALTQCFFFFAIAEPVLSSVLFFNRESVMLFYILCFSSVLIAAAGYIINDYFDINIDIVNKPDRLVVDNGISRRWAMFFHFIFSLAGILMGFYIGLENGNWFIGMAHTSVAVLLWIYSTSFKKKAVVGNLLIALLTAWSLLVVYFYMVYNMQQSDATSTQIELMQKLFRIALLYAAFAFVITYVREIVKDMEDVEGDRKYGCRTVSIVWGIQVSKIVASISMIVMMALMLLALIYILQYRMWLQALYHACCIILPAAYTFYLLQQAHTGRDFTKVSRWIKWVMLSGILSMLLFKLFV